MPMRCLTLDGVSIKRRDGPRWTSTIRESLYGQELRSTAGNFMWSTGPNRYASRYTPAHLDIPMRGCTVEIDDRPVVVGGRLEGE